MPELKNKPNIEYNKWYFINGAYSMLLKLDYDTIKEKLNSKNATSNYITIQAILYTIHRIKGLSPQKAMYETTEIMSKYKFYSLSERHRYLNQDDYAPEEDIQNRKKINTILNAFTIISDRDVIYANERLDKVVSNLKSDMGFAFAFMAIDLTKLENLRHAEKSNFLSEVRKLIDSYSEKSSKDSIDMYE